MGLSTCLTDIDRISSVVRNENDIEETSVWREWAISIVASDNSRSYHTVTFWEGRAFKITQSSHSRDSVDSISQVYYFSAFTWNFKCYVIGKTSGYAGITQKAITDFLYTQRQFHLSLDLDISSLGEDVAMSSSAIDAYVYLSTFFAVYLLTHLSRRQFHRAVDIVQRCYLNNAFSELCWLPPQSTERRSSTNKLWREIILILAVQTG